MSQVAYPKLDILHLSVLHSIARWGTASAAADYLNITPSAISHRLREAERRMGVQLTVRVGSGMRLTEAGERLAVSAERMIDELARAETDAGRIGRGVGSVIRIGVGTYSHFRWLPAFLNHFHDALPETKIEAVGAATERPLSSLVGEQVDVMLMPGQTPDGFTCSPAFFDELVCVVSPSHRLAGRSFVEASQLSDDVHITYSANIFPGFEYEQFFRPAGHYPARLMNIAVPEAVIEMVEANLGISILSKWVVGSRLKSGSLVSCKLTKQGLPLQWNVVTQSKPRKEKPIIRTAEILASWMSDGHAGIG